MQRKSSPEASSPESMRRFKAQLEADIDALSPHSSDPEIFDPEGKTTAEIAAWCAEYERGKRRDRRLMAKHRRMGSAGLYHGGGGGVGNNSVLTRLFPAAIRAVRSSPESAASTLPRKSSNASAGAPSLPHTLEAAGDKQAHRGREAASSQHKQGRART